MAGALSETEYRDKLAAAGFDSVDIEVTRVYDVNDAREFLRSSGINEDTIASQVQDKFVSAFVRAIKPLQEKSCCGPTCCT